MHFEVVGAIQAIENIAVGKGIRELTLLRRRYGAGRWRKTHHAVIPRSGATRILLFRQKQKKQIPRCARNDREWEVRSIENQL